MQYAGRRELLSDVQVSNPDLKEKFTNHIYFLISDQKILCHFSQLLKSAEEEIDRFFNARF